MNVTREQLVKDINEQTTGILALNAPSTIWMEVLEEAAAKRNYEFEHISFRTHSTDDLLTLFYEKEFHQQVVALVDVKSDQKATKALLTLLHKRGVGENLFVLININDQILPHLTEKEIPFYETGTQEDLAVAINEAYELLNLAEHSSRILGAPVPDWVEKERTRLRLFEDILRKKAEK